MSSYSRLSFIFIIVFLTLGCAKQNNIYENHKINFKEDVFILLALDGQQRSKYKTSAFYFEELFKVSNNENYLKQAISSSFKSKDYENMEKLSLVALKKFSKSDEYFTQQLVISMISLNKLDEALDISLELLKKYPTSVNYEIVANGYYVKKDFSNAARYFESSYSINKNEKTLMLLTTILYSYLNQKDVALAYLETYLQTNGCSSLVCDKLMLVYQEQGNIDGMLSILSKMHNKYKQDPNLEKTVLLVENIIVSLLEKKDIKKAIRFLEKNKTDEVKLLNLYYQNGQLKKALTLTRKLYKRTKGAELLGRIAMIEFELANDKKKVLKHVIANFELALSSGVNNASFQNYYGYLLIDYDINIKKGISLVKQALEKAPKNLAYLDSLAWGYYKQGKCDEAISIMAKVIEVTGLKDTELKLHWDKINNCKGNK